MSIDQLFAKLSTMHFLPAECREALEADLKVVRFPKGHYLVQAQTPAHHVFFLEKGFAVSFQYKGNRRVVTDFWQPGDIILSPKSFFEQLATDEIIQLATESELLSLSHRSALQLSEKYPVANVIARDISADYYAKIEERIVDLHTLGTRERYAKLLRVFPGIELHVRQELMASYLNITPQSLSRLKARRS